MEDRDQFSIKRDKEEEAYLFDVDSKNNKCFHQYKTIDDNKDKEINNQNKKKDNKMTIAKRRNMR